MLLSGQALDLNGGEAMSGWRPRLGFGELFPTGVETRGGGEKGGPAVFTTHCTCLPAAVNERTGNRRPDQPALRPSDRRLSDAASIAFLHRA